MKKYILVAAIISSATAFGQGKYFTKKAKITFDATTATSPEKIRAVNENAISVIDVSNGAMEFMVSMTAFEFEKALMGEHFNENYVESDKFPKANFKGSVTNIKDVDLNKDGTYPVDVKGAITIHGVTKEVTAKGSLTSKAGAIVAGKSEFKILLSDFKIEIPSLVGDKVAKEAKIKVDSEYQPVIAKK
jgi:polyisoprenoid-binding protein YceI